VINSIRRIVRRWQQHFGTLLNKDDLNIKEYEIQQEQLSIRENYLETTRKIEMQDESGETLERVEVTGTEGKGIGTKGSDESDDTELEGRASTSFSEVETCIRKMKNGKSPRKDNIVVEMIKNGGKVLIKKILELICVIWKKEEMPDIWRLGIICPIFKKGDRRICDKCRGIVLLDVAYKILSSIMNQRIKEYAERIIAEYQAGFRANKVTIDQNICYQANNRKIL
jgi:hypothetical protein